MISTSGTSGNVYHVAAMRALEVTPQPTHRWSPAKGTWFYSSNPPNTVHRLLQRLVLGIQWEKLD